MEKLATVVDHSTDLSGRHTYSIAQRYALPEYVKQASTRDLDEVEPEADVFADPWRRLFRCHTKAATLLSAAFYHDQSHLYPEQQAQVVEDRLNRFAAFHGIADQVSALKVKAAASREQPELRLEDDDFALVVKVAGQTQRRYPLTCPEEVQEAARYLVKHRDKLAFCYKHPMARRILDKADKFAIGLGENTEILTKLAGNGACSAEDVASALLHRVEASRKHSGPLSAVQIEMLKLARMCFEKPAQMRQKEVRIKTAELMDTFDRQYKLHLRYDAPEDRRPVSRPEDVLFAITGEKLAAMTRDNVETITGNLYKMADLEKLRGEDVRDYLGDDYAEAMTGSDGIYLDLEKAAAVIKTMPRSDASQLDLLMEDKGLKAWAKTARANERKLDWTTLKQLAAQR
jgi:hypothetical protein